MGSGQQQDFSSTKRTMTSPEFRLAIAAIRWSFKNKPPGTIDLPVARVDWMNLQALAARHRIQALLWNALDKHHIAVPQSVSSALSQQSAGIIRHNLATAAECGRLLAAFNARDIHPLFLKGLALGALVYANPFLKMGWDIDLLVPPHQIAEASDVLRLSGYKPLSPSGNPNPDAVAAWHASRKESLWRKEDGGFHLDLHSRLGDNPDFIPDLGTNSRRQDVKVADGIVLPTLANNELYIYLCVHGSSSAWFRLKWLADLAALLSGLQAPDVARLHALAIRAGAGRASAQALLVAEEMFATKLGDELRAQLVRDRANRWLAAIARLYLTGGLSRSEPTEVPLGTALIHGSQLLLAPGLQFKLSEARRQLTDMIGNRI